LPLVRQLISQNRCFFSDQVRPLMDYRPAEFAYLKRSVLIEAIVEHNKTLDGQMTIEEIRRMEKAMPDMRCAFTLYREVSHACFNERILQTSAAFSVHMSQLMEERLLAEFDNCSIEDKIKYVLQLSWLCASFGYSVTTPMVWDFFYEEMWLKKHECINPKDPLAHQL